MKKVILTLFTTGWMAVSAAQSAPEVLVTMPGERLENVIEGRDGTLYFTGVIKSKVYRRKPDGSVDAWISTLNYPQGVLAYGKQFVIVSQDREPDFSRAQPGAFSLAGLGQRLSIVSAQGAVIKTITGPDDQAFYNGMAFISKDVVLIGDSGGKRILHADLKTGQVTPWLSAQAMAAIPTEASRPPGMPNGLKIHDGWVYFSRGDIYKIKIGAHGQPEGVPLLAATTGGTDDFDVARDGVIYASHGNGVIKTTTEGVSSILTSDACPMCTAVRVSHDGKSLLLTGGGLPMMPNAPPGQLSRLMLR